MSSNIFEEAIADAKKLKEVAEENAKKAILESITPQIREFIEEQLLEGDDKDSDKIKCSSCGHEQAYTADDQKCGKCEKPLGRENEVDESIYLDESALSSLAELIGTDNLDSLNESKSKQALFGAVKGAVASMDDSDREQLLNLTHKLNESANHLSSKRGDNNMSRKYYEVDLRTLREAIEEEENEGVDEMDDKMLRELSRLFEQEEGEEGAEAEAPEFDMGEMEDLEGDAPAGGDSLSKDEVEAAIEGLIAELDLEIGAGGEDLGGDELELAGEDLGLEGEEGEEDLDAEALNEVFEVDPRVLRQEINRMKKLVREGKMDHHFGGKGNAKAGYKNAFGGSGAKKLGYSKAFGGGAEGKDVFVNPPQINKLNEAIRNLRRQNRAQSEKLNKYRGAVNTLREQLEDLNLFNAKLLYVNKLLQNKSLNESQKKSVIKALDEAQSLQEAKSLYSSLTETLSRSSGRSTLSESRILGSSSRATTSSQSNATSSNNELSRWQRLAGL
jgi:ribosomal protein S15P/S13E